MMTNLQSSAFVARTTQLLSSVANLRLLLVMLLTLCVSAAWGATETITITQTALGLSGSYTSSSKTIDGVTFDWTDLMKNSSNIQAKATSGAIWNSSPIPGNIVSVAVTHSGTARSSTMYFGASAKSTTESSTFSGTATKAPEGEYKYFYIKRSSNAAYWTKIVITYETTPAVNHAITWKVNGENYTTGSPSTSVSDGSQVTILPTPPTLDCGGKMFVGWSNQEVTDGSEPDVLFTTAENSPAITKTTTFHAVFATKGSNQTATFDAATISGLTKSSSSLTWTHNTSGIALYLSAGQRYTNGTPNTFTVTNGTSNYCQLSAPVGVIMSKVVATLSGTNYKIYSVSTPWTLSTSSTTQTISSTNGSDYLKMSATSNYQIRITNLVVTYTTYSDYTTSCSTETLYSVTYNGNGSTSGSVPVDNTEYEKDDQVTVLGNTGNLAKTGHTFNGWNTKADGTGTPYTAGATFTITENTTLYAQWTAYTVTWTISPTTGGSLSATSGNSITVTPDAAYTYGSPAYTVTSGSATVSQSGNTFTATPSANSTIQINMVEKPKWTVTFNAGEYGTCATTSLTETSANAGVKLPDVTPNSGYRFLGWATTNNATIANAGTAGDTYKPASNITLYAVYKQLHTITWMVGSNSVHTEEVANNTGVTTTPGDPANDAIGNCADAFVGWSEKSAGSTPQDEAYYDDLCSAAEMIAKHSSVTDDKTFYAVFATAEGDGSAEGWTLTSNGLSDLTTNDVFVFAVSADGTYYAMPNDGGTSSSPKLTAITVTNNKITSEVGNQLKWNISGDATNGYIFYPDGSTTTWMYCNTTKASSNNDNIRVGTGSRKAWKQNSSTKYLYNDDNDYKARYLSRNETTDFRSYVNTDNKPIVPKVFKYNAGTTYSNYVTNCCALAPATKLTVSGTTANSATLTWTAPSPTTGITKLQVRDENGIVKVDDLAADATTATIIGLLECTEYTFCIASVGEDCEVVSITITAQPFSGAKTVTFNPNGGAVSPTSETTSCTNQSIKLPTPTYSGYRFMGWYTEANGGILVNENPYSPDADITLHAHWAKEYSVTYNANGGSTTCANGNYIEGETVTLCTSTPSKTGYTFAGWTYSPEVTITDGKFTMPANNVIITAQWTINQYTVTWNPNGGKWGESTADIVHTYDYGATINRPADPTRDGHRFTGWNATIASTMPANNITYTAQWKQNYTITFHDGDDTTPWTQTIDAESIDLNTYVGTHACGEYNFAGWSTDATQYNDQTANITTWVTGTYTPTANIHLYAVYVKGDLATDFTLNCDGGVYEIWEKGHNQHMAGRQNGGGDKFYTTEWYNGDCTSCEGTDGAPFTITKVADNTYTLQNADGQYITRDSYDGNADELEIEDTWENADRYKWIISEGINGSWRFTNKAADSYALVYYSDYFQLCSASSVTAGNTTTYDLELTPAQTNVYQSNPNCGPYTITFETHGGEFVQGNYKYSTAVTTNLTDPTISQFPSAELDGYTFAGWKDGSPQEDINYEPYLKKADDNLVVSSNKTYHAVYYYYDEEEEIDWSEEFTTGMYADVNGTKYFLSGTPNRGTMSSTTDCGYVSEVTITPGTGENAGKYKITVNSVGVAPEAGETDLVAGTAWWTITETSAGSGEYKISGEDKRNIVLRNSSFGHYAYNAGSSYGTGYYYPRFGKCLEHHWTSNPPIKLTVTYNPNGATSGNAPIDNNYYQIGGKVYVLGSNDLQKENYAFGGWNTQADGLGDNYEEGEDFNITKNTTLYAKWDCATYVNITKGTPVNGTFNLSVTGTQYTCENGFVVSVTDIVPATGYRFDHITQDGVDAANVEINNDDKTVTYKQLSNGSSTINVVFAAIPYTVTWDPNGGNWAGSTDNKVETYNYGASITKPADPTRTGYTFAGWEPEVPATMPAEDQTFKAIWENCRWVETTIENIEYGDDVLITVPGIDANGVAILNMMQDPHAATNPTIETMNVSDLLNGANVDATLIWNIRKRDDNQDNFTIYRNGSTTDRLAFITNYGVRVGGNNADSIFTLTPEKYLKSIATQEYLRMATSDWRHYSTNTTQTLKLYKRICLDDTQHWVTWDANGGLFADGSTTQTTSMAVGATITHPANPTREGYTFTGWSPTTSTVENEDITFVAQWKVNTYTVTWNANGGKFGNETSIEQSYTYGATITAPDAPTRVGYTFADWNPAPAATMPASNLTYNAQWNCTSPTDIKINGAYIVFPGETIELTVTGDNIADDATYQWFKKKGDSYDVLEEQTTNKLRIDNCVVGDAANYKCVVTNGTCSAESNYTVKMYRLRGLTDDTWNTEFVFSKDNADDKTAILHVDLAANTTYQFKLNDGSVWYWNEGTMTHNQCTDWVIEQEGEDTQGKENTKITTTISGTYIFTLDYTDASKPLLSVIYPQKKIIYLDPGVWDADNAKFVVHAWTDGVDNGKDILMTRVDDCNKERIIYQAEIEASHDRIIFVRCNPDGFNINDIWSKEWNRTNTLWLTIPENQFNIEAWTGGGTEDGKTCSKGSWSNFIQFYTISYNMNGHGTQISDDCIEDGDAWSAPTDPTAVGYTFLGWRRPATTNDNTLYKNGQTGFTPTANEELTAQWSFSMEYEITGTANVTSAVGQTIKATTPLQLAVSNMPVGTKVAISAPNITFYDEAGNAITEVTTKNNPEQFNLTIAYTPTVEKTTEKPTITLSVLGNEKTFDGHISARSLPNTFAIVAKVGNLWYALPSQGLNSTDDLMGYAIEVDNQNDPTLVTSVPANADWSLRQVYAGQNVNATKDRFKQYGNNLVFVNSDIKALNASKSDNHVLTDATYEAYKQSDNQGLYEWTPTTNDLETYQLTNANPETGRNIKLSMNITNIFGVHKQNVATSDLRFLPIQEPRYTQAALQVVEWKENSVVIMYNGDPAQMATLAIDGTTAIGSATLNKVNKDVAIYELPASGLMNYATKRLLITIGNGQKWLTVPYIINNSTTDVNVLSSTNTTKEVAAVTDVVVLNDATFTAAGTKNDKYTFRTIHVYGGGKLVVPSEATEGLGIYSLVMRSGTIENGTYTNSYPQLVMNGKYSNTSGIYLDYITTYERYYALSVPYPVKTKRIKYPADIYGDNLKDGGNIASFALQYYDGAARATGASGWKDFDESGDDPTLTPYQGYTFWGAPRKVSVNGGAMERQKYGIHRIQLTGVGADDLLKAETSDKTIDIIAYPAERPNDMGWNFLGNPYLAQYGGLSADNELVQVGLLEQEMIDGKWTGGWKHTGNLRYITTTTDGQNYTAVEVDKATFSPFNTFFIQAAKDGALQFASASRAQQAPVRQLIAEQQTAKEITTGIILTGNDQTDRTGLLIADNFTEEYDFNADLSKFENSGINLYTIGKDGKLAFMAINQALAEQPIPLGYGAPADGEYAIAFDEDRYNATDISALYLIDYDRNEKTNLLHTDYSFVTTAGTNNERFALQVAFIPQNATSVEWVEDATIQVAVDGNSLLLNNLPTDAGVQVFDALGRVIYATPNAPTEMQITLPTGYYLVRIADKQHAVVINTVIP